MLTYPRLGLPEAWKPLFRALAEAGWELADHLADVPEWAAREVLVFHHRREPWLGERYLCFLEEPIWCGNVFQARGFSVAAVCRDLPDSRESAEKACLPLTGDWEFQLVDFVAEVDSLKSINAATSLE